MPDRSGLSKLGQGPADYQCVISMTRPAAIAVGPPPPGEPDRRPPAGDPADERPASLPCARSAPENVASEALSGTADSEQRPILTELLPGSALDLRIFYSIIGIRRDKNILDRAFRRCLESARSLMCLQGKTRTRCRTRRVGTRRPPTVRASFRRRTNPNEEPRVKRAASRRHVPADSARRKEVL